MNPLLPDAGRAGLAPAAGGPGRGPAACAWTAAVVFSGRVAYDSGRMHERSSHET
ncbi:MAG: hypothetical protein JXQ71_14835 [Verrucomicrobia bacterium]|nr:hypothetical protein [Verrucomicrobiota bacterium]